MARERQLRGLILALDVVVVVCAILLAAGLHAALREHVHFLRRPPSFSQYALIVYLTVPLWLFLTMTFGLHRLFEREWTRGELLWDLVKLHATGLIGLAVVTFLTRSTINRSLVVLFLGSSFLLSYFARGALIRWLRYQHASGMGRRRIVVVCEEGPELQGLLGETAAAPRPPEIVGTVGPAPVSNLRHLGTLAELARVLHDEVVDLVVFLPPFHKLSEIHEAVTACDTVGVAADVAIDATGPTRLSPTVAEVYGRPFLSFDPAPKAVQHLAIKHAIDWISAFVGLLVLSPLLLVVSIAVLVTMGRPVFFTQTRAGWFGRQFKMIKFRTMIADAESKRDALQGQNEMTGPVFKIAKDPRVTRLGSFLRKSSIDELPQLINVVLGQMSLVGPRPLPIKEQQAIRGWQRKRLSMRPGITGIWQVSGRSNIDFEEWMRLDQQYVDTWSLGLDLRILLKTVGVVLLRRGAR